MLCLLLPLGAGMLRAAVFEVANCIGMRYSSRVIVSFRHKGLEALYERNSTKGVEAEHVPKLRRILSALDVAVAPGDLDIPGFRLHSLKGRLRGNWLIWVSGNSRVTFRAIGT